MPVGVVEQVGEQLGQASRIRRDVQVVRHVDDVHRAPMVHVGLGDGGHDQLAHVERRQGQRRMPSVDPAGVEQVADESTETFGLRQIRVDTSEGAYLSRA